MDSIALSDLPYQVLVLPITSTCMRREVEEIYFTSMKRILTMIQFAYEVPAKLRNRDKKYLLSLFQIKSIRRHPCMSDEESPHPLIGSNRRDGVKFL